MRQHLPLALLAVVVVLGGAAFVAARLDAGPRPAPRLPGSDLWPGTAAWAESTLRSLTLEQKVSQLFSARAYAYFTSTDDPQYERLVDLVERFEIGGITFFQGEPLEQAVLANDLQRRAEVPLLVSQDMEWGAGMRVEHTTTLPRTMALGATRNPELAYAAGWVTAQEARALGTHHVFAPVADVNNNPYNPVINVRSFGERPELVGRMASSLMHGLQEGGVLATAKHFPGHGDTDVDSHADLPVLPFSRARLDTLELVPFRDLVEDGVMSVMTAHLSLPQIEPTPNLPGSLSPRVTKALLRDELGFEGLIVTDGLDMRGVTKYYGVQEAAVRALEAGADMLLLSEDAYAARTAILDAVASGRLTEARIDASVQRILQAKAWVGLDQNRLVDLNHVREVVASEPHKAISAYMAAASLTLLRNENNLLPLRGTPRILSITLSESDAPDVGDAFGRHLLQHLDPAQFEQHRIDRRSPRLDVQQALRAARRADIVVLPAFVTRRLSDGEALLAPSHQQVLQAVQQMGKPAILIAFGSPYLTLGIDQPEVYLVAYGSSEASQKAAVDALFGQVKLQGTLPVTVPGLYEFGDGMPVPQYVLNTAYPEEIGMRGRTLRRVDSLIWAGIERRAFPGAAVAIGRGMTAAKLQGYGYYTYDSEQQVTPQSPFDLASLTKVIATTTAAMQLYEAERLDLDAPVATYLPAFSANGKGRVTVRQLLTHTAGLIPFRPFHKDGPKTRDAIIASIMAEKLIYEPGTESRYSDLGMITLALVIEEITGQDFATYAQAQIFEPLGMTHTRFRKAGAGVDPLAVPTELDLGFRGRLVQGEVHDETAYLLGGTAGHAGLFSTAEDLARFAAMLANDGVYNGRIFLQPQTIRLFTTPVDSTKEHHTRALGWDTRAPEGYSSAGQRFGPNSFGHTGFTGTSLWIDPDQDLFVILLTNRVYPTRENKGHVPIRPALADIAYEAIVGPPELVLPERIR